MKDKKNQKKTSNIISHKKKKIAKKVNFMKSLNNMTPRWLSNIIPDMWKNQEDGGDSSGDDGAGTSGEQNVLPYRRLINDTDSLLSTPGKRRKIDVQQQDEDDDVIVIPPPPPPPVTAPPPPTLQQRAPKPAFPTSPSASIFKFRSSSTSLHSASSLLRSTPQQPATPGERKQRYRAVRRIGSLVNSRPSTPLWKTAAAPQGVGVNDTASSVPGYMNPAARVTRSHTISSSPHPSISSTLPPTTPSSASRTFLSSNVLPPVRLTPSGYLPSTRLGRRNTSYTRTVSTSNIRKCGSTLTHLTTPPPQIPKYSLMANGTVLLQEEVEKNPDFEEDVTKERTMRRRRLNEEQHHTMTSSARPEPRLRIVTEAAGGHRDPVIPPQGRSFIAAAANSQQNNNSRSNRYAFDDDDNEGVEVDVTNVDDDAFQRPSVPSIKVTGPNTLFGKVNANTPAANTLFGKVNATVVEDKDEELIVVDDDEAATAADLELSQTEFMHRLVNSPALSNIKSKKKIMKAKKILPRKRADKAIIDEDECYWRKLDKSPHADTTDERPLSEMFAAKRNTTWTCHACQYDCNDASLSKCYSCHVTSGEKKSLSALFSSKVVDKWECPTCLCSNSVALPKCPACDTVQVKPNNGSQDTSLKPILPVVSKEKSLSTLFGAKVTSTWECPTCMCSNNKTMQKCPACETPQPKVQSSTLDNNIAKDLPIVAKENSLSTLFGSKVTSTWDCPTCMCSNSKTMNKCPACETAQPGVQSSTLDKGPAKDALPVVAKENSLSTLFQSKVTSTWDCPTCMCSNSKTMKKCPACETSQPGVQSSAVSDSSNKPVFGNNGGFKFGASGNGGVSATNTMNFGNQQTENNNFNIKFGSEQKYSFGNKKVPADKNLDLSKDKTQDKTETNMKFNNNFSFGNTKISTENSDASLKLNKDISFGNTKTSKIDTDKNFNFGGGSKDDNNSFSFGNTKVTEVQNKEETTKVTGSSDSSKVTTFKSFEFKANSTPLLQSSPDHNKTTTKLTPTLILDTGFNRSTGDEVASFRPAFRNLTPMSSTPVTLSAADQPEVDAFQPAFRRLSPLEDIHYYI